MKKASLVPVVLALLVSLSACSRYPTKADDGADWDEGWEMLGPVLGVEAPGHGFTLLENDTVLAGDDTYYASWTAGEPVPYVNENGRDADLYPAQIYLLLYGCGDEEYARSAMEDFIAREEDIYTVTDRRTDAYNGQEYTVLVYDCDAETNPYERGASAFGIYRNFVVVAELTCVESFTGDEQALLADFLNGCHYSSELLKH